MTPAALTEATDPYRRFFWIIIVSLIGGGVTVYLKNESNIAADSKARAEQSEKQAVQYATLSEGLKNLVAKVDSLAIDVKAGTQDRYTGTAAATNNAAMLNLISAKDAKIDKLAADVADLREYRAATEARAKP